MNTLFDVYMGLLAADVPEVTVDWPEMTVSVALSDQASLDIERQERDSRTYFSLVVRAYGPDHGLTAEHEVGEVTGTFSHLITGLVQSFLKYEAEQIAKENAMFAPMDAEEETASADR